MKVESSESGDEAEELLWGAVQDLLPRLACGEGVALEAPFAMSAMYSSAVKRYRTPFCRICDGNDTEGWG